MRSGSRQATERDNHTHRFVEVDAKSCRLELKVASVLGCGVTVAARALLSQEDRCAVLAKKCITWTT